MPKNKLHNLFTYGFEIEGLFGEDIPRKIEQIDNSVEVEEQDDGSVSINSDNLDCSLLEREEDGYENDDGDWCEGEHFTTQELCVGVFDDYDNMIKALKVFKHDKNYAYNDSCGLHLHIKPIKNHDELKFALFDFKLIKKIQAWASDNLCDCVKDRLNNNNYCMTYKGNLERVAREISRHEKYRFVSNHPLGTAEFRFFAPCKHMIINIDKFLSELFSQLESQKLIKKSYFRIKNDTKESEIEQGYEIDLSQDNYVFDNNDIESQMCRYPVGARRLKIELEGEHYDISGLKKQINSAFDVGQEPNETIKIIHKLQCA